MIKVKGIVRIVPGLMRTRIMKCATGVKNSTVLRMSFAPPSIRLVPLRGG